MLVKVLGNPDISKQQVLDPLPCLQGIRHCPLYREQRGSSTQCQFSRSRFCLAHLVGFVGGYSCYSRLPLLTSLHWQVWVSATTLLSWQMHRSGLSFLSFLWNPPIRNPDPNPVGTICLTVHALFSLPLPHHCPFSSLLTTLARALPRKPSHKVLTAHLLYPFLYSLFSSLV